MAFLLATGMVAGFGGSTNIVVRAEENGDVTVNESGYPITSKEITITVSGPKPSGLDDWTQLADIEEYAKRLGIRLDCNFYETDWETQLTLMVAGDELPDLLTGCNMNIGDVNEWGGEGYFLDLGQYLDEMPNLQAYFEKYPEMKAFCSTSDGHIYGLPRLRVDMTDRLTRSFINKVWLENLGLEVPTSINEYYDALVAFKNQDANGNGDTDDEIPLLYTAASGGYSAIDTTFLDAFGIFTREFVKMFIKKYHIYEQITYTLLLQISLIRQFQSIFS